MESFLRKKFKVYKKSVSTGVKETAKTAEAFSRLLKPGQVIGLLGRLGAGKTHFIKGAAKVFKIKAKDIVSPTFNLVKEHGKDRAVLYHFDLYRLQNADELEKIGYWEYVTDENAVAFIEWPDKIEETWKDYDWIVEILHKGKNKRMICIYEKKSKVKIQKSKVKRK